MIAGADVLFASRAEGAALAEPSDPAGDRRPHRRADARDDEGRRGREGRPRAGSGGDRIVVVDPTGAGDAFCAGFLARWVAMGMPSPPPARARRSRPARSGRGRRAAALTSRVVLTAESTFVSVCLASPSTIETLGS